MTPELFAAARGARLEAFDKELEPVVEQALTHWSANGRSWYAPIVAKATELWRETFTDSDPTGLEEKRFRASLVKTLRKTTDPAAADQGQPHRIAYWVSTYTANHAEHRSARLADGGWKQWVTMHDSHVRPLHVKTDGEQMPADAKFDVGGYLLRFPGDPVGPPEVWINCRCLAQHIAEPPLRAAGAPDAEADTSTGNSAEQGGPMADVTPDEVPFYGIAAPTDTPSGDGRQLSGDGFNTRTLPLPFNYQPGSFHGGDAGAAQTVGRVDSVVKGDDGFVRYTGAFVMALPYAAEALAHVQSGSMRGVSVDLDDTKIDFAAMDASMGDIEEMTDAEFMDAMQSQVMVFSSWRIAGITQVAIPAFQEAFIALGAPGADATPAPTAEGAALAASASMAPAVTLVASATELIPGDWFHDPKLSSPTPFTVMDNGRVFGHVATWGTCHIGIGNICRTAPHSATGYSYFRTGVVATTLGDVPVGQITMGAGHADLKAGARAAAAHYDNVASAVADVAAGEDAHGIWVAGALRPSVNDEQLAALKAAALSGDWRDIRGNLEMVAALAVNVPGFPIPRNALAASGAAQLSLVAAGVVPGPEVLADQVNGQPAPVPEENVPSDTEPAAEGETPNPDAADAIELLPQTLRAIDASIDTVVAFLNGIGDDALGPEGQQARDLAVGADDIIDQLMRDLGIPDPEDEAGQPGEPLVPGEPEAVTAAGLRAEIRREFARREALQALAAKRRGIRQLKAQRLKARIVR